MSMTRRTLLAAGPAAVGSAAGLGGGPAAAAPAAPPPALYRYAVGEAAVTALHEGMVARPIDASFVRNAPFEAVQGALERAFLPRDALPITFTPLLLDLGGRRVLIDTGFADNGPASTGGVLRALDALGLQPGQIDAVVISHFHPDHILGLRRKDGSLTYPNAQVLVPEPEAAFWMDDGRRANPPEALKPTLGAVQRAFEPKDIRVERYAWGKEVLPGLTALDARGHTPGHTAFALHSGEARLLVMSDVTNHPALFVRNPDWSAIFDMDADQARATRHRMLQMAASERLAVAFYHAPFPAAGHIAKAGEGYELVPLQWGVGPA
ncbi:beta-lactamase domain protein [Methylobacterium sp. 4-46]|uniref:MBL fold metallo-hydrolase n=1 Tax=unclassified Methylobacterium TaxID=2615210 RepID=UPI000152D196|nr:MULTISPECIES: MBL fold metallo-hydrolase [Methylobacterium]ACA19672.1 beta-lactamase domain protein [Methylobacterium sp. 4-46]WFT78869.1 MBL fold metallo-hydrolase [Methylobacterium nodulans]